MDGEVGSDFIRDVQVDDPVHEVEAGEANWKDDSRIFVDTGRGSTAHVIQVLAVIQQRHIFVTHGCHLNHRSLGALENTIKTNHQYLFQRLFITEINDVDVL